MNNIIAAMKLLSENELRQASATLRWLHQAEQAVGLTAHQVLNSLEAAPSVSEDQIDD